MRVLRRNVPLRNTFYIVVYFILLSSLTGCAELSLRISDASGLAGADAYHKGDYQTALLQYEQAYEREVTSYEKNKSNNNPFNDKKGMAINAVNIADCYALLENHPASKKWALKAKDLAMAENYDLVLGPSLLILAQIHNESREYQKAIETGESAERILQNRNDEVNLKIIYITIGEAYAGIEDIDKAEFYFSKASVIKKTSESPVFQKFESRLQSDIAKVEEKRQPPMLVVASVTFSDENGKYPNGALDAEEQAELVLKIENQGKGSAFGVTPVVTQAGGGFSIGPPGSLEKIAAGETKEIRIPVVGKADLSDGLASIKVDVKESRGHDANPVTLSMQTGKLKPPDLVIECVNKQTCGLEVSGNSNGRLDAFERAELVLKVQNRGEGVAYDVTPEVSILEGKGFTLDKTYSLGTISAGESKKLRVPVVSGLDLKSGEARLQIEAKEKRGLNAKKLWVEFQTERLKRPNLVIKPPRINDSSEGLASGNGDGVIENSETAELDVIVENTGEGDAEGVKLFLEPVAPPGVEVVQGESEINRIGVGEAARGKVVIRVPRQVQIKELMVKLRAEEVERKAASTEKTFNLPGATLKPDLVANLQWSDKPGGKSLSDRNEIWENGKTLEGVLTVKNQGKLVAEGVEVTIRVPGGVVKLGQEHFQIGRIEPNQTSITLRTTLTIPRTFSDKKVVIETVVEQQDFDKKNAESQDQPVTLRKPKLVVTRQLLNQTSGDGSKLGSVLQNERTKLELTVRNDGALEAQGVSVSVVSERPETEIQLEGERKSIVGTILPGQVRTIQMPLFIKRAALAGAARIRVDVTQDDLQEIIHLPGELMVLEEGAEEVKVTGQEVKTPRPTASMQARSPIYVVSLTPPESVKKEFFEVEWDELDEGTYVEIFVNGKKVTGGTNRGIALTPKAKEIGGKRRTEKVPLSPGPNTIVVTAYDRENKEWPQPPILVTRKVEQGVFWALLIGIDDYYDHKDKSKNWSKLTTAVSDATSLQKVLEDRYGFEPKRVKLLTNREASREGIISAFQGLTEEVSENDSLLIYYAGHGKLDNVTGYWIPVEAEIKKQAGFISNSMIRDYLGAIKAKHIFLVSDSCFSGSLLVGGTRSEPPVISERYYQQKDSLKSRQAITSGGNEPVSDGGRDGHSIFAYYFLKALRENNEPYLAAQAIITQTARSVANNSTQTPVGQHIKDVQDEGGEFIFGIGGKLP